MIFLKECIAIELWHRFAPEYHIEWSEEMHQAEYIAAAEAVLCLIRAAGVSQPAPVEPCAWVIPGDDQSRPSGSVDAMAWQEGEFTKPLYAHPPAPAQPAMGLEDVADIIRDKVYADENDKIGGVYDAAQKVIEYITTIAAQPPAASVGNGEPTPQQIDAALSAWFKSPPSETDQGLERSMKAALIAAGVTTQPQRSADTGE